MSKARKIEIFRSADGIVELTVTMGNESAWLTQRQVIDLFDRDRSVISRHINKVFRDGELIREGNMQKMHIAHSDKPVALYSLDVIISVGYRSNPNEGSNFGNGQQRFSSSICSMDTPPQSASSPGRGVDLLTRTLVDQRC
jgi:hypothetical protein